MLNELWLIPALPLAGFLALAFWGARMPRGLAAFIGAGSVGVSAALTILIGLRFISTPPTGHAYTQVLWTWFDVSGLAPQIALRLDPLSLVMTFVVTGVGFLVDVYSAEYMRDDAALPRFFAYMNLFVCSMLILVLADNLLLLYLGWEGVGLCSYLLIGFWYSDPANCRAANKAFIVTRIGDTAMAVGLFLLAMHLGSLNIHTLMERATQQWAVGSPLAIAAAALLLGGAVGKSGQLPLQVWLPDAMAGPTPVSALIHAATMVTAGVYLIARTHVIFELAPVVQCAVAVIGALTLLIAGFSALAQRDIKRILAYSTISQIGYMFLALGVGAWDAAIFHFFTHAFFKALLFMAAGAIIVSLHHEQDIFKMGGLRRQLPAVFWTFLAGALSLAAFPLISAGFYSKDEILWQAWSSPHGGPWLWMAGLTGALLTSVYTFRAVFIVFFGEEHGHVTSKPGGLMTKPLWILAIASTIAGLFRAPITHLLETTPLWSHVAEPANARGEFMLQLAASGAGLIGIYIAASLFLFKPGSTKEWLATPTGAALNWLSASGGGFDWLYNRILVQPFIHAAQFAKNDFTGAIETVIAYLNSGLNYALHATQTGKMRWYATLMAVGAVITLAIVILL